ncbi:UNVERIFIED_CONTAM: hypothetical protein FKN15_049354 [Acipenser sinensis]
MERWHAHQRELKEGGATWCLACLEYGHLPEVCPYEDPLFVQAFDRGEVETAEEWIHLKAIPSPQVDQETCLTCLKGKEWCFAVGKVGHKPPDQPPPWQEVELLVPKKGRRGGAKRAKKQSAAAAAIASRGSAAAAVASRRSAAAAIASRRSAAAAVASRGTAAAVACRRSAAAAVSSRGSCFAWGRYQSCHAAGNTVAGAP